MPNSVMPVDRGPVMDELALGEALMRLGTRLYRLQVEALESLSLPLSVRQYRILDRIDRGISSMTELAALARRRLPTISKSADSLVRQGLLTREHSPTDRRVVALMLTAYGRQILAEALQSQRELAMWLGARLEAEVPQLGEPIVRLYAGTEERLRSDAGTSAAAPAEGPTRRKQVRSS